MLPSVSVGLASTGCSLLHGCALPLLPGAVFLDICVVRAQDPLTHHLPHLVDSCTLTLCFPSQHEWSLHSLLELVDCLCACGCRDSESGSTEQTSVCVCG